MFHDGRERCHKGYINNDNQKENDHRGDKSVENDCKKKFHTNDITTTIAGCIASITARTLS